MPVALTRFGHDHRALCDRAAAIHRTREHRVLYGTTLVCFIADVERSLRSDRLPAKHASVVAAGLQPVAEPGR